MMKKELASLMKVSLCILVVLSLGLISSCKKSDTEGEADSQPVVAVETPATETAEKAVAAKPAVPKATETAKAPAAEEAAVPAGMVLFKMDLPKPMFVGTPQDTRVANLEKPLGHARPPFLAPAGTKNVALGKPVTSSDEEPIIGEIDYITDGDMEAADGSYVELGPFVQHVTIDLEAKHDIYAIVVWHYHKQARVYFDMVVQVADDPDFIENVVTVFNNDIDNTAGFGVGTDKHYSETNEGKLVHVLDKGVKARYVRAYSNGNTSNDLNHYIEIAVFGKPAN